MILDFNQNEREHTNFADTLGGLQGEVVKGRRTKTTANAYYIGIELLKVFPTAKAPGEYFLKKDSTFTGGKNYSRSTNRIIVKVDAQGKLIENEAWIWRHDDRILKLGAGFFKRAVMYREMTESF